MKNLIRKILREEVTIKEVIDDLPQDSYINMNIKNYPKYKKDLEVLLKDKLDKSGKDFVKFKKSVVKGYDRFGTAILSDDLKGGDKFMNTMKHHKQTFESLLYNVFNSYHGIESKPKQPTSSTVNCDPRNFKILDPLIEKGDESLKSFWVTEKGAKVFKIKLPDECLKQLTSDERNIYVTLEPTENRIHFPKGVPERLRGKKLGTLIYLAMIKKIGYITSSMGNSPEIKMVYKDLLTNPTYSNDIMSLLLQKQVILIDKNTSLDVKKVFNDFVKNKFTEKKYVRISDNLKKLLGDDYIKWYNSLGVTDENSIKDKIEKNKNLEPHGGDTVYDVKTKKVWNYNWHWDYNNDKNDKIIQLSNDKFETINVPYDYKSNLKVIHRAHE